MTAATTSRTSSHHSNSNHISARENRHRVRYHKTATYLQMLAALALSTFLLLLWAWNQIATGQAAPNSSFWTSFSKLLSTTFSSWWHHEIWNLPPQEPWPGTGWLDRIADSSANSTTSAAAILQVGNRTYATVYAAWLDPPQPCRNVNAYINSFLFTPTQAAWLVPYLGLSWTHVVLCYVRNFLLSCLVYYGTAGIFHIIIYQTWSFRQTVWTQRTLPTAETMWHQIRFAQFSIFLYVLLPVVDEWLIEEQAWTRTRVYYTIPEVGGWIPYFGYLMVYFAVVELGIYWVHRTLHTNKWLYKHIHLPHHQYNRPDTLTPWASIAFHPLDGILQASPYVLALWLVPCHYLTHLFLLFLTAIWATYIHDALDFNFYCSSLIMGSKYHTVHHTHYMYNFGQVFTVCDALFGTLRAPTGPTGVVAPTPLAETASRHRSAKPPRRSKVE